MPKIFFLFLIFLPLIGCSERDTSAPMQPMTIQAQSQTASSQQRTSAATIRINVQILPTTPTTGDDLRVVASGVSGRLTYRWEINGQPVEGATGATLGHDLFAKGDRVTAVVNVGDLPLQVETLIYNAPPRILSVYALPNEIHRGLDIIITPNSEDPDGDNVTYQYQWLINGEEQIFETSEILPGNAFHRGDSISVIVIPNDGENQGEPFRTGGIIVGNAPPHFVSSPPQKIDSTSYRYAVRAVDPDDDPLLYRLELAPSGMTIDEKTGDVIWEITSDHAGENIVSIVVSDPEEAGMAQEFSINLSFVD